MKRAGHLIEPIVEPENLRLAFWKARRGKKMSREIRAYETRLDENLLHLGAQLGNGKVLVGNYHYFKVYDPKEREICASAFSEQVLHHALMNVCHDYFERIQIYDSYASRKGKGTYAAISRARTFCKKYSWYLKLDVRKFFASIHHDVLKTQLRRLFKDPRLLGIFDQIVDSYEASPSRGVPIGNLSSQYFANHYLAGLDHFVKEQLGIKAYTRYMDDMILWHEEKTALKSAHQQIRHFTSERLKCQLKPEVLGKNKHGLPFLGYLIYPHYMRLSQRSKQRFIKKINLLNQKYHAGAWPEEECQRRVLPLLAFILHADTKKFRKNVFWEHS